MTRIEDLDGDAVWTVYLGAVVGVAHLAAELERLGLASEDESLEDARQLRPMILEAVEAARRRDEG